MHWVYILETVAIVLVVLAVVFVAYVTLWAYVIAKIIAMFLAGLSCRAFRAEPFRMVGTRAWARAIEARCRA